MVFRTDASVQIGSGHVMRCLTLADALKERGAHCHFISRAHPGHMVEFIRQRGYLVYCLAAPVKSEKCGLNKLISVEPEFLANQHQAAGHASWLGSDWLTDAQEAEVILNILQPDWLVVDHYAISHSWESALSPYYRKLMVIDDLADRAHYCDLLLDQNWHGDRTSKRYRYLVPPHCKCYLGPEYALLKPEYAKIRTKMKPRNGTVSNVLVFMGGSDPTNQTEKVLTALMQAKLTHLKVDVVLGQNHPDAKGIAALTENMPNMTIHQGLPSLAPLMERADLMIGAGGSTTWERMCLGLPTIVISIATNQSMTNQALMNAGYINFLGEMNEVSVACIAGAIQNSLVNPDLLIEQGRLGQTLVSGMGAKVISEYLLQG